MPYVAYSDLSVMVPVSFLNEALDDIGDGSQVQATFDAVAQQAGDAVDGYLGLRYAVPIAPDIAGNYPAVVVDAARVFTAELLYKRRGIADEANPWAARAAQTRMKLKAISLGEAPLSPTINRLDPSASIITEPLRTVPHDRGLHSGVNC